MKLVFSYSKLTSEKEPRIVHLFTSRRTTNSAAVSHIPPGHQGTSIHHISVVKGSSQAAYRCEILNREFMFSDQLQTVIRGLYGPDVAQHTNFYVDQKRVNRHGLLDEYQGKDVHVTYADQIHDSNRIGSFTVPVLERHQTLRHH